MSAWARAPRGAAPEAVTVKAEVDGRQQAWQLPVVDAGSGQLPIPTLWAREHIRGLEEAHQAGGRGSRQARTKAETLKLEAISLAREFGLSCSLTSWIAIEEREERDRQTGELILRKVPVLVTVGWHGMGSVLGTAASSLSFRYRAAQGAPPMPLRGLPENFFDESESESVMYCRPEPGTVTIHRQSSAPWDHELVEEGMRRSTESADTDLLMFILSLQRVDGGFDPTKADLKRIGINGDEVERAAAGAPGDRAAALRVMHTAMVLAFLEARFPGAREAWFSAVKKSRAWLKRASADWGAVLEGKTVARWAKEVVASTARTI